VTLFEDGFDEIYNNIFSRIYEIENLMSVKISSSDVSRINASAGIKPVQVHDDTFKVIERAYYFASLSEGAFDPTVGPLVSLWGFGSENFNIPSQEEIDSILPLVNWQNIELDTDKKTVFLMQPGMALDLGAIAKGYAADEIALIVRKSEVKRAIIDLGGNVIICGEKEDKSPWKVGIQSPGRARGIPVVTLHTAEKTIVTSGVYERYFTDNGIHYHHLMDPSTGYPARSGLLSVSIITDNSMDADALSTVVFVLGYEKGRVLVDSLPNTEALFIFDDKSLVSTKGLNFTLTDKTFFLR